MNDNPAPLPPSLPSQPLPPQALLVKPGLVSAIGGMRLASGCVNILVALSLWCCVYPLLLIPLGIVEIVNASSLLANPPMEVKWLRGLAILEIVTIVAFNVPSTVIGIVTLVFLQNEEVRTYFARLGHQL